MGIASDKVGVDTTIEVYLMPGSLCTCEYYLMVFELADIKINGALTIDGTPLFKFNTRKLRTY
jgi:hypothetical protein